MTRRATLRGAERAPLADSSADVLVCGASFAGLAVARELAGSGADVLLVDRYEIGERATSACAAPLPWLEAMGVSGAIRQELPCMGFHTPHGSVRYRLPWSWAAFDYAELCRLLFEQCDARFEIATVTGRTRDGVLTDRGELSAPLVVDALGWRRVLARERQSAARGAAVARPRGAPGGRRRGPGRLDRALAGAPRLRLERARRRRAARRRRLVRAARPRARADRRLAQRLERPAVRYQGNWFPHRLRTAAEDGVFFVGDSAGHCFPLSGEGIRTAFYFGIACGRELRRVLRGRADARAGAALLRAPSAPRTRGPTGSPCGSSG